MVRIHKRVNQVDLRTRPCGRVNKGEEKGTYFGKDLNDKLRFHANDTTVATAIHSAYTKYQHLLGGDGAENYAERKAYDVIVKHLNIVFPGELDEVFDSSMKVWNGKNEIMRICDRRTILQERYDYLDLNKQPCSRLQDNPKPCPIADEGMATACPLGCVQESTLTFQIAELLMGGEFRHVVLTTHSWEDEAGIPAQLELLQQAYGSIAYSEFEWKGIGKKIPFVMSRYEVAINRPNVDTKQKLNLEGRKIPVRTGGKSKSTTWAIAIKINPLWHLAWTAWEQDKKAKFFGLQTSPKALIQSGIIDAEIIESPSLTGGSNLAIAPADDSWKIKAYEHGIECGIEPNLLKDMVTSCTNKEDLRSKLSQAKKALKSPPIEPLSTEPEPQPIEVISSELTEATETYVF